MVCLRPCIDSLLHFFVIPNILVFKLQFLDMSSLQAALPDALLPAAFGGIAEPWLPQNTVTPYISSAGEGKPVNLN
jgi:hypothetical protein